jgi:hypothetical protein
MNEMQPTPDFEEKIRKAMRVPDADLEFTKKLRNELVRGPVRMKPRMIFKPAWVVAFALALVVLAVSTPGIAAAFGRIFGYVPGTGLVETTSGLRMLAEPASVTREGVTVTVTQALVYEDHVELTYEVDGIQPSYSNEPGMCGYYRPDNNFWSDADADLRLPDGTVIRRDYAGKYQSENRYAMKPIYAVSVPSDVSEMTMVLKCLPFTRLGDVPENWEVPFKLVSIPAGAMIGEPVIEVAQPVGTEEMPASLSTETVSAPKVTMTLERIVPTDSNTVLYLHFNMENADPSLISIMPRSVYVIDSMGQQIRLIGSFVWQPFEHQVGSSFEFVTESKPASGSLTVVADQMIAYYMPLYTDPPLATPEEMTFTFDAGENPQYGQKWELNKAFTIAGYQFEIVSAQALNYADIAKVHDYVDGSQGYEFGYQFSVEADPSLGMSIEMDIMRDNCWISDVQNVGVSPMLYTQLCRDGYPSGSVAVTISEISITINDDVQVVWTP